MDNGTLDDNGIKRFCTLNAGCKALLDKAYEKLGLTMRGYKKMLKLFRTIADLDGSEAIEEAHLADALMYRMDLGE